MPKQSNDGIPDNIVQMGDSEEAIAQGLARMGRIDQTALNNLERMKDAITGILTFDTERYVQSFADHGFIHEPESLFYGGKHVGHDAINALAQNVIGQIYERTHFRILEMGAGGDHVFIRYLNDFVFKNSGETVRMEVLEFWRLEDGKVVECRPFIFDVVELVKREGAMDRDLLSAEEAHISS